MMAVPMLLSVRQFMEILRQSMCVVFNKLILKAVLRVNVQKYKMLDILNQRKQPGHKMDGASSFQKLCQTISITLQLI